MTKQTKHQLDNIELIDLPGAAIFELRLVVAMDDYDETDECTALDWLFNILTITAEGKENAQTGAQAFLHSMMGITERRVHLCTVERIEA